MLWWNFCYAKTGKTWDDVTEPSVTIHDIDTNAIDNYLKAALKSGRLPNVEGLSLVDPFEKLRPSEGGKLKQAAIILFGKDPGKFYPNMVVKMGRFGSSNHDLKFQETAEGNLIYLMKEVPDILNKKFFTKPVSFEGLFRIEKGEYPVAALREMLLNALVHRDYMGSNIQMRMHDNRFSSWNEGLLPQGLSLESLKLQHPSRPRNLLIADVCFKGGYIDAWGRGTLKIINSCLEAGLPEPEIIEQDGGILVTLFKDRYNETGLKKMGLKERQVKAVLYVSENGKITNKKYQDLYSVSRNAASDDLRELVQLNFFKPSGVKGAGAFYTLCK